MNALNDEAVNYNSEGTWGRSSEAGGETYIIFASHMNSAVVQQFMAENDIGYRVLLGGYKGMVETAYIINRNAIPLIEAGGIIEQQESLLELGPIGVNDKRPASLVFKDQHKESLGSLVEVTKADAMSAFSNGGGYTYDPALKKYFTTQAETANGASTTMH